MPQAPATKSVDKTFGRRALLRIGALGAGGLTIGQWLRLRTAQAATTGKAKAAILFWLAGGPSHIDMFDMKPAATKAVRGPFQPIATRLPGLLVNELMPRHAEIADKLAIVRSISHNLAVHDDGSHWMQTGYPLLNARAQGQQYPCEGSVVSYLRGPRRPGMPAYVCIPEVYHTLGIDPKQAIPDRLGRPIPLVPRGEPIRELV